MGCGVSGSRQGQRPRKPCAVAVRPLGCQAGAARLSGLMTGALAPSRALRPHSPSQGPAAQALPTGRSGKNPPVGAAFPGTAPLQPRLGHPILQAQLTSLEAADLPLTRGEVAEPARWGWWSGDRPRNAGMCQRAGGETWAMALITKEHWAGGGGDRQRKNSAPAKWLLSQQGPWRRQA